MFFLLLIHLNSSNTICVKYINRDICIKNIKDKLNFETKIIILFIFIIPAHF